MVVPEVGEEQLVVTLIDVAKEQLSACAIKNSKEQKAVVKSNIFINLIVKIKVLIRFQNGFLLALSQIQQLFSLNQLVQIRCRLPIFVATRSEEHTSELQSRENLVCRLLLEKKNKSLQP